MTLQVNNAVPDSLGQAIPNWVDVTQLRCSLEPRSGTETINAGQLRADVTNVIITRYPGDGIVVDATMQLTYEGNVYKILSVLDIDNRHKKLVILANFVTTGGV